MPLQIPVTQTGLEASIQQAMKNAGRNAQINLGTNSRQINALAQPLGRITGQADEFTKSMEAANARVFAFGASVGIINGVSKAFGALVKNTIEVEKSLVEINTVLNTSGDSLQKFGNKLFDVAKTTGQTFDVVAKGALELARQGLSTEETLKRINDALILSRLSGLDAQQSVEGLTAAFNSFKETGITTSQILNKLVVVSQKYSVSERDLIEGLKRSASVADQAGVSFDELVGIITTVQERTARGGAVIGNAFKTIFARIQDTGALQDLANLGIQVTDLEGKVLPATRILQNLGAEFNNLSQLEQADIAKKLGGVYQLSNLLAAVKDLSSEQSKYNDIVKLSAGATNEAYQKNAALNETLAALINKVSLSAQQLGATLGAIGITDNLKQLLDFFNKILEGIQGILGEESMLGDMFRGLAKGIGNVLAGPGLALFGAIIAKLSKDLISFGIESLKSFFKIGQAAKDIASVEKSIAAALGSNLTLQKQLFALEGNRAAQIKLMTDAIVQQEAVMRRMTSTASSLAAPLYQQGVRSSGGQGLRVPKAAGGYMPAVSQESRDISRGVGGAKAGDKPVVIPNFAFGGGKKGTMVAHTGEYIVPNFAAGGSAVFNRDMVRSMGLPAGAQKIGAAGGFIPNFASSSKAVEQRIAEWRKGSNAGPKRMQQILDTPGSSDLDKEAARRVLGLKGASIIDVASLLGNRLPTILTPTGSSGLSAEYIKTNALGDGRNLKFQFKSFGLQANGKQSIKQDFERRFNEDTIKNLANRTALSYARKIVSSLDSKDPVKPETLEEVDKVKGFIGSVKGAFGGIFDAAVTTGVKAASRDNSKGIEGIGGDFDVNAKGDARDNIIKLFGSNSLSSDGLADYKINAGKYSAKSMANKVLSSPIFVNTLKAGALNKASNQIAVKKASKGYIPNFAKYIYDSDRIPADKGATLKAILASSAKKNLIIGPAGSGKSTLAGKLGKFLTGASDVANASEIDILSGAARAKGGGLSKNLEALIASVNASGGKVSYLYTKNLDILSRRIGRTSASDGDLRSKKQLIGTRYAPLNQFDFMGAVKSRSRNFNMVSGAGGYIPNFADPLKEAINREMSAGIPTSQIYVDQNSSLKNSMNPMGLMVANRRDEPGGGMQGVSRARREGVNPMTYGASRGFVPNYANTGPGTMINSVNTSTGVSRTPTGTTTSSADVEKPKRDLLGVIFAVQTGLSLLTGATADATSGLGKLGNAIGSVASAASTVALVGQGLSGLAKEGGTASAVLGKIGIYGAVAAGAFEAFKQVGIYLDSTNGSINKARGSMERVADAASKAAVNLSTLKPSQQEKIKQSREALISGATTIKTPSSGTLESIANYLQAIEEERVVNFEGVSDVLEESFNQTIDQALAVGVSYTTMWNMIQEAAKEGSSVTADEVNKISQEIEGLIGIAAKFKPEDFIKKFNLKAGEGFGQKLINAQPKQIESFLQGSSKIAKEMRDLFAASGISNPTAQIENFQKIVDLLREQANAQGEATDAAKKGISEQVKETLKLLKVQQLIDKRKTGEEVVSKTYELANQERILAISSDLSMSETQRAKALVLLENAYTNVNKEIEAGSKKTDALDTAMADISEKSATFKAAWEKDGITDAVTKAKSAIVSFGSGLGDAELISAAIAESGTGATTAYEKLAGVVGSRLGGAYQQNADYVNLITDNLIKYKNEETKINSELEREIYFRGKLAELTLKQKQIEEDRKNIVEKVNYNLESRAGELDYRAGQISNATSLNQAQKEVETAIYEKTKIATSAEDYKKGLDEINQKYFDLEQAAALKKVEIEAKANLIRNSKVDENSVKIGDNTTAINELKGLLDNDFKRLLSELPDQIKTKIQEIVPALSGAPTANTPNIPSQTSSSLDNTSKNFLQFVGDFKNMPSMFKASINDIRTIGSATRDTQRSNLDQVMLNAIASVQAKYGADKLPVTSLRRTDSGQHKYGKAVDFDVSKLSDEEYRQLLIDLKNLGARGFGDYGGAQFGGKATGAALYYQNMLHADWRNTAMAWGPNESGSTIGQTNPIFENFARNNLKAVNLGGIGLPNVNQTIKQLTAQQFGLTDQQAGIAKKLSGLEIEQIGPAALKAAEDLAKQYGKSNEEVTKIADGIKNMAIELKTAEGNFSLEEDKENARKIKEYFDSLPKTFGKSFSDSVMKMRTETTFFQERLGEAIPTLFADNLAQAIQDTVTGTKSLEDALLNAASSFVSEIQSMTIKNLANTFTSSVFGFSQGGEVKKYASGGMINGGSGSKDDVPAMLMGGEYVVNKKAVQKYGPEFLSAINNGTLGGYAKGGPVQTGQGGFYTPGTYGKGGIQGRQNLLDFATQTATSGQYDVISGGDNYASINLEAESMRLTNFGRSRGPMADALRSAKEESFGLYQQDVEAEKQRREQEKELAKQQKEMKKQMLIQIGMAVASSALGSMGQGAKAGWTANAGKGFGAQLGGAFKGSIFGAQLGGSGPNLGGLGNWAKGVGSLFTGNFKNAGSYFKLSQMSDPRQLQQAFMSSAEGKTSFAPFLRNQGYIPKAFIPGSQMGGLQATQGANGIMSWDGDVPSTGLPLVSGSFSNRPIKLHGPPRATGGTIPSTSGVDTVPAMLSGGEFIMNRAASQNIGAGNLQALNAGASSLPTEEKTEELNDRLVAKLDELIATMTESANAGSITINVDSNGKSTQETSGETSDSKQKLAAQIKDTVMKVIEQEKRLGGKLRRGL